MKPFLLRPDIFILFDFVPLLKTIVNPNLLTQHAPVNSIRNEWENDIDFFIKQML